MKEKYNILDNNSSYILSNSDNYINKINFQLKELLDMYITIINEYLRLFFEKIFVKKINYFKFILIRGLETISNVFKFIIFFTKNTNLTYYHSQKAFYFYIEFIEQISVDQNSFLKLTSRDAVMFVYKKTIFDINNEFKKNIKEETIENKSIFGELDNYLLMYKNLIYFYLQTINEANICIDKCCEKLKIWSCHLNNNNNNNNNNNISNTSYYSKEIKECMTLFLETMENNKNNNENLELIDIFIENITDKKNNITVYENIKNKLETTNLNTSTIEESKAFISYLFTKI